MTPRMKVSVERTSRARCHAEASPSFSHVLVKVVVKAVESAPSAKRSRSRLGMRNAAMKASANIVAPNMKAKICSRTTPIRREPMTEAPTTTADRFELRFSSDRRRTWLTGCGIAHLRIARLLGALKIGMASSGTAGSSGGGWSPCEASGLLRQRARRDRTFPAQEFRRPVYFSCALTVQFPQQLILEPDLARVARRDVPADRAIEKSALEHVALCESRQRVDGPAPRLRAPVLLVGRLRPERGIVGAAVGAVGGVFIGEMMQMPRQNGMLSAKFKLLVHAAAGEARLGPAKKPHQPVGIPVAVANPAAAIKDDARDLVAVRRAAAYSRRGDRP